MQQSYSKKKSPVVWEIHLKSYLDSLRVDEFVSFNINSATVLDKVYKRTLKISRQSIRVAQRQLLQDLVFCVKQ